MKVFQVTERYESAFSSYDADYLLSAASESEAREAAEKKSRRKEVIAQRPFLSGRQANLDVRLTVVEIFDQERIDRLEERVRLLEKNAGVQPTSLLNRIAAHFGLS